jgi:GNAT superfamily N-acetyltransferase
VRSVNDQPASIQDTYYPMDLVEQVKDLMSPTDIPQGTTRLPAERGHLQAAFVDEVEARMPTPEEAALLGLAAGTPVIKYVRTGYTRERAVRVTVTTFAGDRNRIIYTLGDPADALYAAKMLVPREHAGQGLGSQMLDRAGGRAFDAGLTWLRLDAWTTNPRLHQLLQPPRVHPRPHRDHPCVRGLLPTPQPALHPRPAQDRGMTPSTPVPVGASRRVGSRPAAAEPRIVREAAATLTG